MDEKEELRNNRRRMKALIDANHYNATRSGDFSYLVAFTGKFRDWTIRTHIYNGWFCLSTFVLELPETPGVRAAVLERVVDLNSEMAVAKFSRNGSMLKLELECRADHVDAPAFAAHIGHYYRLLEQHYPALFRIASGDEALASLQNAFERPSLAAGADA